MRVLLYINSLRMGGAERVLTNLSSGLSNRGFEVMLVTQTNIDTDAYIVDAEVSRVCLDAGETSQHNMHAAVLNFRRIRRLRSLFRRWCPERIVAFLPTASFIAAVAGMGLGIPIYISERSFPGAARTNRLRSLATNWAHSRAEQMIVQTGRTADWYKTHQNIQKVTVIPNSVSLPLTHGDPHVDPRDTFPEKTPLMLCAGRLVESKQMEVAIRMFDLIAPHHPDWHLVVLGSGPLRQTLQNQIAALELQDRCHLLGPVGNIEDWYREADIFISASRLEGFPTALLEAMACGCVPIAFDCLTGPSEIIDHGENGVLTTLNDVDAMVAEVHRLINNPHHRRKLSIQAKKVIQTFSAKSILNRWVDLLNQSTYSSARH